MTLEQYYLQELGWDKEYPVAQEPRMVDERHVNDETWVQFRPAGE